MTRFLLLLAPLVLTYGLVLVSAHPWDIALAAAAAATLLWATRRVTGDPRRPVAGLAGRVVAFVPFAAVVAWDIARGTWAVASVVLHFRPLTHPGIVALPLEERSRLAVTVWALTTSLSPGSVLVDVDWQRRLMLIHFLDASDPDQLRAEHHRFYHRYQRRVFP